MGSHQINGQPWPSGTTVEVYRAEAQPASSLGAPAGSSVTSAVVSGPSVLFENLTVGRRYVAYAAGKSIGFLVQPGSVDTMRPISGAEAQVLRETVDSVESKFGYRPVNASDYQTSGVSDETALLLAADAASDAGRALYIPRRAAEWVTSVPIPILGSIEVFGDWTVIRQSTWRKAIFDLETTDDVDVHHFYLRSTETRVSGNGSFRGDDEDRYGAGVWGAGDRCKARHLRVEGLDSIVFFGNWTTGSTHAGRPVGNRVEHVRCADVDFGVLAGCQDQLHIEDVAGSYVRSSGSSDPGHLIYVNGVATTNPSRDLTGGNWRAFDSTVDAAFQLRHITGGGISNLVARNCGGLLMYENLIDFTISDLVGTDDQKADENGSIFAIGGVADLSRRLKMKSVVITKAVSGRAILFSGTDCDMEDVMVVANRPVDNGNGDIEIDGTRNRLKGLRHRNVGSSTTGAEAVRLRPGSVDCEVIDPEIRNDPTTPSCQNGIIVVAGATRARVRYDPFLIVPKAGSGKVVDLGTGTSQWTHSERDNGQAGIIVPTVNFTQTTAALTAGRAYFARFVPSRPMTVTLIGFAVATAAGADDACDVGIYDAAFNRLVSSGATNGKLNSTGAKTIAITPTALSAGKVYYAAFSVVTPFGGTAPALTVTVFGLGVVDFFGATAGKQECAILVGGHPLAAGPLAPTSSTTITVLAVRES